MAYSVDTNANSGVSASATIGGARIYASQGLPPWAIVAIAAAVALVFLRRKG